MEAGADVGSVDGHLEHIGHIESVTAGFFWDLTALRKALILVNLRCLCSSCRRHKTRLDCFSLATSGSVHWTGGKRCGQGGSTAPGWDFSSVPPLDGCRRGRTDPWGRAHRGIGETKPPETLPSRTEMGGNAVSRLDIDIPKDHVAQKQGPKRSGEQGSSANKPKKSCLTVHISVETAPE